MKGQFLGSIRAENDQVMLDKAFYETDEYKSILNFPDRCIVVGRRGTGKSALVYSLTKHWNEQKKLRVIKIIPDEDQIIGLRDIISLFGDNFRHIKAGSKLAWRYAIYMEVIFNLAKYYKAKDLLNSGKLKSYIEQWQTPHKTITGKLRAKLKSIIKKDESPQSRIADLSENLELDYLAEQIQLLLEVTELNIKILIDQLDEGYTPDTTGVALVDGFIQAITEINSDFSSKIHGMIFLRDNIYRSIVQNDPDFTRNLEPHVLRLHWDEQSLFRLVCMRIGVAFEQKLATDASLWTKYTARNLKGKEGFRAVLRLTLYRPRDILSLLNDAYLRAAYQDRKEIIDDDINSSAKSISEIRLHDLHKEYETIFPAMDLFTKSFIGHSPEYGFDEISEFITEVITHDTYSIEKQTDIAFFSGAADVLKRLYGVGFIGIQESGNGNYIFCHDGRDPIEEFTKNSRILIHPCYWRALNLTNKTLEQEEAQDIYDEYDITITSIAIDQQNQIIGSLIKELGEIPEGESGAYDFENWCLKAVKLVFAGAINNIELHPNGGALQRRDIVATNLSNSDFWSRIQQDFKVRQIIFEIKNYQQIGANEYRQINSYLVKAYGKLGFFITRDDDDVLRANRELQWAKELYNNEGKIAIKLSAKFFAKHLSKMRNPEKRGMASKELNKILDDYERKYLTVRAR
jgi:hypothetical protein